MKNEIIHADEKGAFVLFGQGFLLHRDLMKRGQFWVAFDGDGSAHAYSVRPEEINSTAEIIEQQAFHKFKSQYLGEALSLGVLDWSLARKNGATSIFDGVIRVSALDVKPDPVAPVFLPAEDESEGQKAFRVNGKEFDYFGLKVFISRDFLCELKDKTFFLAARINGFDDVILDFFSTKPKLNEVNRWEIDLSKGWRNPLFRIELRGLDYKDSLREYHL